MTSAKAVLKHLEIWDAVLKASKPLSEGAREWLREVSDVYTSCGISSMTINTPDYAKGEAYSAGARFYMDAGDGLLMSLSHKEMIGVMNQYSKNYAGKATFVHLHLHCRKLWSAWGLTPFEKHGLWAEVNFELESIRLIRGTQDQLWS